MNQLFRSAESTSLNIQVKRKFKLQCVELLFDSRFQPNHLIIYIHDIYIQLEYIVLLLFLEPCIVNCSPSSLSFPIAPPQLPWLPHCSSDPHKSPIAPTQLPSSLMVPSSLSLCPQLFFSSNISPSAQYNSTSFPRAHHGSPWLPKFPSYPSYLSTSRSYTAPPAPSQLFKLSAQIPGQL